MVTTAYYYDIETADGYAALSHLLRVVDIKLGFLSSDGLTRTPKPGRMEGFIGGVPEMNLGTYSVQMPLPIGETIQWTELLSHPTQSGRYALLVDQFVYQAVSSEVSRLALIGSPTAGETALLNVLRGLTMVALDSSWTVLN